MKGQKLTKKEEAGLIKKIQNGDEKSFARVYDYWVAKIYRYVYFKIGDRGKVEEIVQDVFWKFWRFARNEQNEVKEINALLYSIAKSMVADHYRSEEETMINWDEGQLSEDEAADEEIIEMEIDTKLDIEKVKKVLLKMPQIYQDVIIMRYIEEMEHKEMAEALGKEEGNIRVLIHRALKQLRELLKEDE